MSRSLEEAQGLSSIYIENVLSSMGLKRFAGVYASDKIPHELISRESFSICLNLDKSTESGSHWVVVLKKGTQLFYIDSLGLGVYNNDIHQFLKLFKGPILINDTSIQSTSSPCCGFYAIFFCMMLECPHVTFQAFKPEPVFENDQICIKNIKIACQALVNK